MKTKVGIDICVTARMKIEDDKFLHKFLHPLEIEYLKTLANDEVKRNFAAGRWAAKEAIYKADNFSYSFNEIEIGNFGGKPLVLIPSDLQEFAISISHDGGLAIAIASLFVNE